MRGLRLLLLFLVLAGVGACFYWGWKRPLAPSGGFPFSTRLTLPVPSFRQNDPRWGGDYIGATTDTMGGQGCAVASAAMVLAFYGVDTDPQRLNWFLDLHGGYTPQGWLYWERAADFAPGVAEKAYEDRPSYFLIDWNLWHGNPVIVRLHLPGRTTHFVVIMGKEGWDYLITDPGAGNAKGAYPLKEIGSKIEALRFYRRLPPGAAPAFASVPRTGERGPESGAGEADRPAVIFDTDMSTDCDDAGALAVLNRLADLGEARILACVVDSRQRDRAAAAAVGAINAYYGRPDIPIGVYHGNHGPVVGGVYQTELRDRFPHHALPDDQEPDSAAVYRSALASAADQSVTIVAVGSSAALRDLLDSAPDAASPLPGLDLVRAKVSRLVVMGGRFPRSAPDRGEYNFVQAAADTRDVVSRWPTPILFSGFEIGYPIPTGKSLAATPPSNPVRRAYELSNCLASGRSSWDLTAVLAAVRDPGLYWDVVSGGTCTVSPTGTNEWAPAPDGRHAYLAAKVPPGEVAAVLDGLLAAPPVSPADPGAAQRAGTSLK